MAEKNIQHNDGDAEASLRLFAVADQALRAGDTAAVRDVPRSSLIQVFRVARILADLSVDADGPKRCKNAVHEESDEWWPDMQNEHDAFAE